MPLAATSLHLPREEGKETHSITTARLSTLRIAEHTSGQAHEPRSGSGRLGDRSYTPNERASNYYVGMTVSSPIFRLKL
jgi:hypothetical protein